MTLRKNTIIDRVPKHSGTESTADAPRLGGASSGMHPRLLALTAPARAEMIVASRAALTASQAPETAQNEATEASELRRAKRRSCRSPATITGGGLKTALNCFVCDSSATGALLEFGRSAGSLGSNSESLPERFTLNLTMDRVSIECRLVWRSGKAAGVQYAGPARLQAKPAPRKAPVLPPKSGSLLTRLLKV